MDCQHSETDGAPYPSGGRACGVIKNGRGDSFSRKEHVLLSDAAWETAEPFAVRAKAEGKTYCQNIEENLSFYGDRNSIQQLISILLDNAVKYTRQRLGKSVCIFTAGGGESVLRWQTCVICRAPWELERLFDRFYRVDEARSASTGGTGIGLAMAQAIVETHGGKIKAERTGEKLICFRVLMDSR